MQTKSLTSGPIPNQIRDLALPSSIGLFFNTMYNVVDSFYAGRISTTALAALGLSFPVFLLIIATGGGLSRGASALIANAIGSNNEDEQRRFIAQSLSMGVLLAGTLTVIGFLVASPLFQLLGADGEYLEIALEALENVQAQLVTLK
jgi:Na+-driven multidrug efflux pump